MEPSYRYSLACSSSELTPLAQARLFEQLKSALVWEQESLLMFGRDVLVPRRVAFIADRGLCYRYTGKDHYGKGWPNCLAEIRKQAEYLAGQSFNSVLLNWYQNGDDYMGWHADNETILGPAPVIAMLSLGATRDFLFRLKKNHSVKHSIALEGGSWLVMSASTQVLWQHCLPKRKRVQEERISLTFRTLLNP
ncbi:alpha-ketoglutarate-dependent dioxygenase AlkB family protein [Marinomonas spartinae]|uniref:alpha-ketoglutarate-dependent dioxygenase AlkB family protein n=1 Tax=Marinomonas spartinae TaxID=1792290 RepID=UPI0018F1CDF7|nr:alpha-ketoglutarate-dependent dioxygenase AlkB [Marinomonas spartinae]MBJ7553668.1 alpha-ketoglutarate-dependent dioxygenase AlkB [Marinomonas spartinae]